MKKNIILCIMLFAASFSINAQTPIEKQYIGQWTITTVDVPTGDMTVPLTISYKNGKLQGVLTVRGTEKVTLHDIRTTDDGYLTAYIEAPETTVAYEMVIDKKNPDIVKVSMIGIISFDGVRVKPKK